MSTASRPMAALTTIDLPSLRKVASGKVRDLYAIDDAPDRLLFVASDRLSAFDVVMANGIPNKGVILTLLSAYWFGLLPQLVPGLQTHFIGLELPRALAAPDEARVARLRSMQVRRLRVLPIEAIVRGYLTGSAWREYAASGTVHGIAGLPPRLPRAARLPTPLYTPSTKAPAGGHDENIHPDQAAGQLGGDAALAARVRDLALRVYSAAAAHAEARGLIIADTKFEFAVDNADPASPLYLADEVLTPDSSRFWVRDAWCPGHEPDSLDKQVVRDWLVAESLQGRQGVQVPDDVCRATELRYKDVFLRLTGQAFDEAVAAGHC